MARRGSSVFLAAVCLYSLAACLHADDAQDRARALLASAETDLARGRYDSAAANAAEAARIFAAASDAVSEARSWNDVGQARFYQGDYEAALDNYRRALERASSDAPSRITVLNNIGNVLYYEGKYADAYTFYQRALDIVDHSGAAEWTLRRRQLTLVNIATLFQRLGRNDAALQIYQRIRAMPQALPQSGQAQLLANMGVLYRRLGDPLKALDAYRYAQTLFRRDSNRDGEIGVLKNIGIALALDLNQTAPALTAFDQALKLAEQSSNRREMLQGHLYRAELLRRMGRLPEAGTEFQTALTGAGELGAVEERWKALYGLGRVAQASGNDESAHAYYTQAAAAIESVRSALRSSTLRAEFLADKRDVYDSLIELLLNKAHPHPDEVLRVIEQERARNFRERLRGVAASANTGSVPIDALAARLSPSTLLVEFWVGPRSAAAVWIGRSQRGLARIPFGPEQADKVQALAAALSQPGDPAWRSLAGQAGAALLGPIRPLQDQGIRDLILVPDEALQLLPMEALLLPGPGGQPVVERFTVSYLPTAFALGDAAPDTCSFIPPWRKHLLAFGDPTTTGITALPGDEKWQRLPGSAGEVRSVASILGGRADVHTGPDALKKYLNGGRPEGSWVLHFSTHAVADTDDPDRSRMLFSPEPGSEHSEYLFAREIYGLDLHGVELATLSACDTERGALIRGEGVQGFSRALLAAGARTTVTTLWRVGDTSSAEFMKQFYSALAAGDTKSGALRAAKLAFLHSGTRLAHPAYWAQFVLSGDAAHPIARVIPWTAIAFLGVAAAALPMLAFTGLRRRSARTR